MESRRHRAITVIRTLVIGLSVLLLGFLVGVGAHTLSQRAGLGSSGEAAASASEEQDAIPDSASEAAPDVSPTSEDSVSIAPVSHTAWDESQSPNYYQVIGPAVVDEQPEAGVAWYGSLDELGRATGVIATVSFDSMMAGRARSREDLSMLSPSGWGFNQEVDIAMPDGSIYHGQFFNRSHLLAKSLGGDDQLHNLVTGTRTQNVGANIGGSEGGMAYGEGLARGWLESHPDGTVYYAVTPAYEGDELVARSVIVDVRTSDGSIDQRIEVFNAARGFSIDYATGAFEVTEPAEEAAAEIRGSEEAPVAAEGVSVAGEDQSVVPVGSPEAEDGERKIIVTGSGKAYHHDESCKGLENARSMEWVTVSEAESMGRRPCGICGG